MAALKPGRPIGEVFDAYARSCDNAGMKEHRLNATGYSLGTTFAPNWMDWPMFYHGNPVLAAENMVFFLHMILMDSDTNHAMCFGHTVVVTANRMRIPVKTLFGSGGEITEKFAEASKQYHDNPVALQLRGMNMLFEGLKEKGSLIIVPSSALESMNMGAIGGLAALSEKGVG